MRVPRPMHRRLPSDPPNIENIDRRAADLGDHAPQESRPGGAGQVSEPCGVSVDVSFWADNVRIIPAADNVRIIPAWDVGAIPAKLGDMTLLGHGNLVRHHALALPYFRSPGLAACFKHGYTWCFACHIEQADDGCDFDFLETAFGAPA